MRSSSYMVEMRGRERSGKISFTHFTRLLLYNPSMERHLNYCRYATM